MGEKISVLLQIELLSLDSFGWDVRVDKDSTTIEYFEFDQQGNKIKSDRDSIRITSPYDQSVFSAAIRARNSYDDY